MVSTALVYIGGISVQHVPGLHAAHVMLLCTGRQRTPGLSGVVCERKCLCCTMVLSSHDLGCTAEPQQLFEADSDDLDDDNGNDDDEQDDAHDDVDNDDSDNDDDLDIMDDEFQDATADDEGDEDEEDDSEEGDDVASDDEDGLGLSGAEGLAWHAAGIT